MTASPLEGVDWQIVAIFAALVLLEGLRRVPAGALVLRGLGPAGWRVQGEPEPHPRWRLVSCWSPVAPTLVLPPLEATPALGLVELDRRVASVRRAAPWLAGSASVTLLALILGLPAATAWFSAVGLFLGAAAVCLLAIANACAGSFVLRRLGVVIRRGQILAWCSPFAAGRVLEGVFEAALAGASPAQAARALVGEAEFATWCRPRAYDVVFRGAEDPDLRAAADRSTLEAIVASTPPEDGWTSFCPRCAVTWRVDRQACPACAVPATGGDARHSRPLAALRMTMDDRRSG